jgi:hypothetical protein
MRILFFLIFLAGAGAGIIYPWAVTNFTGREIATLNAYDRVNGFRPIETQLEADDAPVRVLVDLTALNATVSAPQRTVLTVTASTGGRTVLAETLSFSDAKPREGSPQLPERIYRDDAGLIADIEDGAYRFVVGPGDAEGIQMQSVDVILRGGALIYDERAQPVGFSLMAIGFIGLVLALRNGRRGTPQNPNSQPPPPRWGRGGNTPS